MRETDGATRVDWLTIGEEGGKHGGRNAFGDVGAPQMSVLVCGVDGWDLSLADYFAHPFWESIRDELAFVTIPKPDPIADGEVGYAPSPRIWGELFTGMEASRAGPLGFWRKITEAGEVRRADVPRDWISERNCGKVVDRNDVLVPPLWEQAAMQGKSVGTTCPWFSYPLPDQFIEMLDEQGTWALSDFPLSLEHLADESVAYPPAAHPAYDFIAEVGLGVRAAEMVECEPEELYAQLLAQDEDRYRYTVDQLNKYGSPDFCLIYTRSTDRLAPRFIGDNPTRDHFPEYLSDGVGNLRSVYDLNFDGIQRVWESGDFENLLIGGDHGVGVQFDDAGEPYFPADPEAQAWPATWAILSPEIPVDEVLRATNPDITPTALDLLGVSPGEVETEFDGVSLVRPSNRESQGIDLGDLF